jgi:hypothetical protein
MNCYGQEILNDAKLINDSALNIGTNIYNMNENSHFDFFKFKKL